MAPGDGHGGGSRFAEVSDTQPEAEAVLEQAESASEPDSTDARSVPAAEYEPEDVSESGDGVGRENSEAAGTVGLIMDALGLTTSSANAEGDGSAVPAGEDLSTASDEAESALLNMQDGAVSETGSLADIVGSHGGNDFDAEETELHQPTINAADGTPGDGFWQRPRGHGS